MNLIKTIESTYAQAVAAGCDIVQYKYKGLQCRCVISRGYARIYDPWGSDFTSFTIENNNACCTLLGDYFGPPRHQLSWITVYDCLEVGQQDPEHVALDWRDIRTFSYRDRFAFVRQQLDMVGLPFKPVKNYPINMSNDLWNSPAEHTNGLIWRRSKDSALHPVYIARRYDEMPGGLP